MAYPLVANLCDQGFYRRPARQRLDGFVRRRSAVSHLLRFTTTARAIWPSRLVHPNWHVAVHQNELVFTERILKQFELLLLTLLQESAGFLLRLLGRIFAEIASAVPYKPQKLAHRPREAGGEKRATKKSKAMGQTGMSGAPQQVSPVREEPK